MITAEDVRDLVSSNWEDDLPDTILELFKREAGKPFSKRILAKLPGGEAEWCIRKIAGMTNLENRTYRGSSGRKGYSFLVHYDSDAGSLVNPERFQLHNSCYFAARIQRNGRRLVAKNDPEGCAAMAFVVNRVATARKELKAAEARFAALTESGEQFNPDRNELEKLTYL